VSGDVSGPWYAGCLVNADSSCDCPYIFDGNYSGAIGCVYIDNGIQSIADGGNDCPPKDEARANLRRIVAALNSTATLSTEALEAGVVDKLVPTVEALLQLAIDGGLTHDLIAQVFPDAKRKDGQPADEFAKRARRAINEARAALALARGEQA